MRRGLLLWPAAAVAVAGFVLAAVIFYGVVTARPLELIVWMDSRTYPGVVNWIAHKALFAFHPAPDEVAELNAEAGVRYAAEFRDPETAEALLRHFLHRGVDVDSVNQASASGWTALHGAAIEANGQAVRLLLANGANPALQDREGNTALDLARAAQQRHPRRDYGDVIAMLEAVEKQGGAPKPEEQH